MKLRSLFFWNVAPHQWTVASLFETGGWPFLQGLGVSTTMSQNVSHQSPSDVAPHPRRMETSELCIHVNY